MPAEAPLYTSHVSDDGLGQLQGSQAVPGQQTGQAAQGFGNALGGLGEAALNVGQAIQTVNRKADIATRTSKFLEKVDGLEQQFRNDADPATAANRMKAEVDKARGEATAGLPKGDLEELNLKLDRVGISSVGGIRSHSLTRQADAYTAGVDKEYETYTRRYANAASDAERQSIAGELNDSLVKGVRDGMLTNRAAEAYRKGLTATGDSALLLRRIANDPAGAQKALEDPAQFAGIDPQTREQYRNQARAAAEEREIARRTQFARMNPEAGSVMAGQMTDPRQAELVMRKVFVPQESGGNANAQSVDGAAGVAQIMPDTARALAKRMGLAGWDNLSDAEVRQKLKDDREQSIRMGAQYLADNARKFDGNWAATFASYHAGPGGAVEKAHKEAVAKYGPTYSADQFLEFLPESLKDGSGKSTASYVRDIYARLGVPTSGTGLTPMASYRLSNAVGTLMDQQVAQSDAALKAQTAIAGRQADEFSPLFAQGYAADPQRIAAIKAPLELAAARGDATAAQKLAQLNENMAIAPLVREAYGHRPEEVEAAVAGMKAQMATGVASPEMARRLKVFEAVSSEMASARKENPIALAERQGAPVTSIDPNADPKTPEFAQSIMARSIASQRAQKAYGGEMQFFRPEERVAAKARFEAAGEEERFNILKSIAENARSEEVYRAAAKEMTGSDKLAQTAGMFMTTNPAIAREIFAGSAMLQMDGIKPKVEEIRNAMKDTMPAMVYPAGVTSDLIEAGLAVYAARRGKNAALYDASDRGALEEALQSVIGKTATINGRAVPLPANVSKSEAQALFGWLSGSLTQEALDAQGGAADRNGTVLPLSLVQRQARLVPADERVGDHQMYRVVFGQGAEERNVMRADGKGPLTINLPELVKANRLAVDKRDTAERVKAFDTMLQAALPKPYEAPSD